MNVRNGRWVLGLGVLGVLVLAVGMLPSLALVGSAPVVRVTSSLDTVQPLEPVVGSTTASLRALRGEFESFQLIVGGPAGAAMSEVDVVPGVLNGPGGATIPLANITVYAERYTRIWTPSDQEGLDEDPSLPAAQRGWCRWFGPPPPNSHTCGIPTDTTDADGVPFNTAWRCGGQTAPVIDVRHCLIPDALIPRTDPFVGEARNAFPFAVPAGENRAVWVDVLVPPAAPPGSYSGSITVGAVGLDPVPVTVSVQVIPVTLPPFGTRPDLDLQGGMLATVGQFCVTMGCSNGSFNDQFRAYSMFVRSALEDRLPLATAATFSPLAGLRRTAFDHWIAPYLTGNGPAVIDEGVLPSRLPAERQTLVLLDENASAQDWGSWVAAMQGAGSLNSLSFYCDEWMTNQANFNTHCGTPYATRADPAWPVGTGHPAAFLIGSQAQFQVASGWGSTITANARRLVPNVMFHLHHRGIANTRPSYDPPTGFLGTAGREVWGYDSNNSLGSGPGWSTHDVTNGYPVLGGVDQPSTSERGIGFTSWGYRLAGHFYYDSMHRFSDAWNDCSVIPGACLYDAFGGHGDGTLFYPGTPARIGGSTGIPIESMRLKRYRDGSEDYTLLRLLETGCDGACTAKTRGQLAAIVGSPDAEGAGGLMPNMWQTSVGAAAYDAARGSLMNLFPQTGATFTLAVANTGPPGAGTVTSSPAGIDCGTTCQADFPSGQQVSLTAMPSAGMTFTGWSGACSGNGGCLVTMDQPRSVTATFTANPTTPTITTFTPTSGAVGTKVVINGTNFTSTATVKFNGVTATGFMFKSSTNVSARVPAGATTGPITVTTAAGTGTSAASFVLPGASPPTITGFSPGSGPVGTAVTITGTNFTGVSAVTFNGTSATFTFDTNTQVTANVPAGATTGPITLTTPGGTATSSMNFTAGGGSLPTITSFSPPSGPVGTLVTITGTNFTGATSVTFKGVAASFTVVSSTEIRATVPAGIKSGQIAVRTPTGTATSTTSFRVT